MGLFAKRPKLLYVLHGVGIILALTLYFYSSIPKWAVSLIIGGGISNFLDRTINGVVTDFFKLNIRILPYLNFADIMIFLGVILVFFYV